MEWFKPPAKTFSFPSKDKLSLKPIKLFIYSATQSYPSSDDIKVGDYAGLPTNSGTTSVQLKYKSTFDKKKMNDSLKEKVRVGAGEVIHAHIDKIEYHF